MARKKTTTGRKEKKKRGQEMIDICQPHLPKSEEIIINSPHTSRPVRDVRRIQIKKPIFSVVCLIERRRRFSMSFALSKLDSRFQCRSPYQRIKTPTFYIRIKSSAGAQSGKARVWTVQGPRRVLWSLISLQIRCPAAKGVLVLSPVTA